VPYVDQPPRFWEQLHDDFGASVTAVYLPLPGDVLGSGRPSQPAEHVERFLRLSPFALVALVNPVVLPRPVEEIAPAVIDALRQLDDDIGLAGVTVSDVRLAARIREAIPHLSLAASVLMDISRPNQVAMLADIFDTLVPASRVMRDLPALEALRAAFPGRIRLIVNEACLPGCPFRVQHFHEMASGLSHPRSLCDELLAREPWLRLTGAWVLPQHLRIYDGLYDELKLAGRVTLRDATLYRQVLEAYVQRQPLSPNAIGAGPASVLENLEIDEEFYAQTLRCGRNCHECDVCRGRYDTAVNAQAQHDTHHGEAAVSL